MRAAAFLSWTAALLAAAVVLTGCDPEGCVGGEEGCVVPSPCTDLAWEDCADSTLEVRVLEPGDDLVGGLDALASPGDVLLRNGRVQVVIDALDHPHYLGPTGGGIVDLATADGDDDSMRHFVQAAGVLPDEAAYYTSLTVIDESADGVVAVQVSGHLDGRPDVPVHTRYELRACEPGVRIRTELVNLEPDPISILLGDGHYMGNRELLPFTATPGTGFDQPSFGLSTLGDAISEAPFVVSAGHSDPATSYAQISCSAESIVGFRSTEVSLDGTARRIVMPRDYEIYERFLAAADGPSVSGAVDLALMVRNQLWDEPWVELTGQLVAPGGAPFGDDVRASVLVTEPSGEEDVPGTPWTHILPEPDGSFFGFVPANRDYELTVEAYGMPTGDPVSVSVGESDTDAGELTIGGAGLLTLTATVDGAPDHVLAFVLPADDATEEAVTAGLYGQMHECAPLLGHPHGPSPACNRVLVDPELHDAGGTTVGIPFGRYRVFAVAGPFSTLASDEFLVDADSADVLVELALETVPELQPDGTLTGDFHVHGGASFDTNFPHHDRMRSFLASRLQVIATTEHDAAWDFATSRAALGADDRLALMVGTENTGHILFKLTETSRYPKVVGHWNLWPLDFDPEGPYRGAYWDEKAQPGMLFTRALDRGFDPAEGVIQLNHPLGGGSFGRDFAWGATIGANLTWPLAEPSGDEEFALFKYTPPGSSFANDDYDVQEVMNGSGNGNYLQYRAFWFWLLNQGELHAGTANSDSHSLLEHVVGTPLTLVRTTSTVADFDVAEFNGALKEGRSIGTNGPILDVTLADAGGVPQRPSLDLFTPDAAAELQIEVRAADWVPVPEVRVYVNGRLATTLDAAPDPDDPLLRFDGGVPLADLVDGLSTDAWVVVEAGWPLAENDDLDCDGAPDTGDHDGDGAIDWRDIGQPDEPLEEEPEIVEVEGFDGPCYGSAGPLKDPPPPDGRDGAFYAFRAVVPDGYPLSFTNPLILDLDGDGDFDPPGVGR